MSRSRYLPVLVSVTSTLFRIVSFVFLRVIPSTLLKSVLPLLYAAYATLLLAAPQDVASRHFRSKSEVKEETKKNEAPTILELVRSFILTLPSPSSSIRNLSFLTNTALLLFATDLMTHPIRYPAHDVEFARVGAVYHNSVKLSVRYPQDPAGKLGMKVRFRPLAFGADIEGNWLNGQDMEVLEENDWVASTTISNLFPSTVYEYQVAISNSTSNTLYPDTPQRFKTFPDPYLAKGSHFSFVATSCMLPNFPYVPGRGDQIKGFDLLADYISAEGSTNQNLEVHSANDSQQEFNASDAHMPAFRDTPSTEFMIFLGDFIYADVPIYYGDSLETYRRLYRRTYASPSFRRVYEKLPMHHIYDDHEIINNYDGANDTTHVFLNASTAFELYHAQANYNPRRKGQYYYSFRYADVAYFVMDARRYRSRASGEGEERSTMLGKEQLEDLYNWLAEVNQTSTFKFIVSSVPFTTLWQHDAQTDAWPGFKQEREEILEKLHTVPNVFILSGDRHEFAAIEYNGPFEWSHNIYEFSTSPLSMFYIPFVRTLEMESSQGVERRQLQHIRDEDGTERFIEDINMVPTERVLKYSPIGNYKWASFDIDTRNASRPVISVKIMIDGKLAYSWEKIGDPAPKHSTALGAILPQSFHGMLDKFGLGSRNWF